MVESVRRVELDEAILPTRREDGSRTEDHRKYLFLWEARALDAAVDLRFLDPLPVVLTPADRPEPPEVVDLTIDDPYTEEDPESARAAQPIAEFAGLASAAAVEASVASGAPSVQQALRRRTQLTRCP